MVKRNREILVLLAFALVGWMACAATMGTLMATTSVKSALILHAIAAPLLFGGLALIYFRRRDVFSPVIVASVIIGVVLALDFLVVALLVVKSLEMFRSPLGLWIPLASGYLITVAVGILLQRSRRSTAQVAEPS